ncbi:hypothetical protein [Nocardia abscessus]|uniref:hypothetical protein n=1 Tax=Nocardia abscessus TaxID=120957 RepID=UPI000318D7DA|nr:hypothetical protein [Nocardia abscessus]MCC3331213.1 hypothetical protein [Nocardia abscessus]
MPSHREHSPRKAIPTLPDDVVARLLGTSVVEHAVPGPPPLSGEEGDASHTAAA